MVTVSSLSSLTPKWSPSLAIYLSEIFLPLFSPFLNIPPCILLILFHTEISHLPTRLILLLFLYKIGTNSTYLTGLLWGWDIMLSAYLSYGLTQVFSARNTCGLQYWALVAQAVKRLSTKQETRVQSLGREDLLEKEMAIHSNTVAWKIPWRSLVGYSPWGHKKSDTTERLHLHLSHRAVVRMRHNIKCLFIIWSDTSIQCTHGSRVYFLSPSEVYYPSFLLCVHTMETAKWILKNTAYRALWAIFGLSP